MRNASAQDQSAPSAPATVNPQGPIDTNVNPVPPADMSSANTSQDVSRAQVPAVNQSPVNPQPTNIPTYPGQLGNPISPYNSSGANPQSPQLTTPNLYVTGTRDLSQVSINNALAQAFGNQSGGSDLYGEDTGPNHEHAPIERIRLGPFDLRAALATSAVGDDDLRTGGTTSGAKKSDITFSIVPAILLEYGTHDGEKGFASLVYSPTITRLYHESAQDTEDQNVAFNAMYPFQRLSLNLTQTYTETTGVNTDSNIRTTQNSSLSLLGATYEVDEKISVSSQLQYLSTTFQDPSGNNNNVGGGKASNSSSGAGGETLSVNNNMTYRLSEKLTLGPNVNVGWDRPKDTAKSTFEQGTLGLNYAPTEKIGLFAQGGAEFRQYDQTDGDKINPIFSLGVGYNPFDSTSFQLSASQSVHSSTAALNQPTGGQTVVSTGLNATVTQRIVQRVFFTFAVSYDHEDDQNQAGTATVAGAPLSPNTHEDNISYRPSISYAPTEWSSVALYYQYLTNESSAQGQSYHSNQVGLSLSAQF